jgi:hypothetical protein
MMTTEIVQQVAQLLRTKELHPKDAKDIKIQKDTSAPMDEVELSSTGELYANPVASQSEYEKEQFMKVQRLKSLVKTGTYHMDKDAVEAIAANIAKMFM